MRSHIVAIALLVVCAGCPGKTPSDAGTDSGATDAGPTWNVVFDQLPAALLSAWESDAHVLYAVGGSPSRALVLRHDFSGWWEMDPGTSQALWWVFGTSDSDVTAVGNDGTITHFDGTRWTTVRQGTGETLYGAWGSAPDQLWAVGGYPSVTQARPITLSNAHAGGAWSEVANGLPPSLNLFKIWGTSANDFWVVGEQGLLARGPAWSVVDAGVSDRLVTVAGRSVNDVYAVGGYATGVMIHYDGTRWSNVPLPGNTRALNGVAVDNAGTVVAGGMLGYLVQGRPDSLVEVPRVTVQCLHGIAPVQGGFVAVGGDLSVSFTHGVMVTDSPLQPGAIANWPHPGVRFDAGVDAGSDAGADAGIDAGTDAGSDAGFDAGTDAGVDAGPPLGPGDHCDTAPNNCVPPDACFFVFGPFKSICTRACSTASDCTAAFGPSCCQPPGPQVTQPYCIPVDAGVCDGGP